MKLSCFYSTSLLLSCLLFGRFSGAASEIRFNERGVLECETFRAGIVHRDRGWNSTEQQKLPSAAERSGGNGRETFRFPFRGFQAEQTAFFVLFESIAQLLPPCGMREVARGQNVYALGPGPCGQMGNGEAGTGGPGEAGMDVQVGSEHGRLATGQSSGKAGIVPGRLPWYSGNGSLAQ